MEPNSGKTRRRDLVALLLYALLTVVLAWPLVVDADHQVAGRSDDVYVNLWVDWWTHKAMTEGLDLYHTDYLFYPRETSLVFQSFSHVATTVSLLLKPVLGTYPAYNVSILLMYALCGYTMYLLVRSLTGSWPAGFIAGLIFSFQPYHVFESEHPVVGATQWMPLFVLSLARLLQADSRGWLKHALLGALWFLLTALSSWHLMVMLAGWTALYLLHGVVFERGAWPQNAFRRLAVLALISGLLIGPFIWPIIREQLTTDTAYMAVGIDEGVGNDLLSLFIPNRQHPFLAPLVADLNDQIGFGSKYPGYLGYVCLGLAAIGIASGGRRSRAWWVVALVSLILSLGPHITWAGAPLHGFQLPWAVPITALLRRPLRINVVLFFSLAVLAGYGAHSLERRIAARERRLAAPILSVLGAVLLLEYLVWPFFTTGLSHSPFYDQLAEQTDDFALAQYPFGRHPAKYYLYLQTIHAKRIVDGHISRTPTDAYRFVDANAVLGSLRTGAPPVAGANYEQAFADLAALDIRYIVVHTDMLNGSEMQNWHRWAPYLPTPVYADESVYAYPTDGTAPGSDARNELAHQVDLRLGESIELVAYQLSSDSIAPGDVVILTLWWQTSSTLDVDYHIFTHLLGPDGTLVAQHDGGPVYGTRPTSTWRPGETVFDERTPITGPSLPAGRYTVVVGMYDYTTMTRVAAFDTEGDRLADDLIVLDELVAGRR